MNKEAKCSLGELFYKLDKEWIQNALVASVIEYESAIKNEKFIRLLREVKKKR